MLEAIASESGIYRFYDKKVVISHPLFHDIVKWKLLVILVVIKIYARHEIFKTGKTLKRLDNLELV